MAYVYLPRTEKDHGAEYGIFISITGSTSDTYMLPVGNITSFGAHIVNGALTVTYDTRAKIQAGTAIFFAYDATSLSNNAITGFLFTHSSGTATLSISVKSDKV